MCDDETAVANKQFEMQFFCQLSNKLPAAAASTVKNGKYLIDREDK